MKKADITNELRKYITDITLLSEDEFIKYLDIIPEIKEPWWTKSDGYLFDSKAWREENTPEPMYKQVVYKEVIGSANLTRPTIGVRPTIIVNSLNIASHPLKSKIIIGVYSFTVIDGSNDYIIALCDGIIALKRMDRWYVSWDECSLKSWLYTDGLIRIFASPKAVSDWSCISENSLFWGKNLVSDSDVLEWELKQTFLVNRELQNSIDKHTNMQLSEVLPCITKYNELNSLEFTDNEFESRISNLKFSMVKESHWLNWKYRQYLERIKFGCVREWVEADRTSGTYCYVDILGRLNNFYPKDIYDPLKGHTLTCQEGIFMRPLIFVQTSNSEEHELGEIGYLFEEKVMVLDITADGLYVVPTRLPNITHPLYERQNALNKYERNLYLYQHLPHEGFQNFGSVFQ